MTASSRPEKEKDEHDLQSMDLNQLKVVLKLRIDMEEKSVKISSIYPYWRKSAEAIILEALIRGSHKLMEGDENQLRCSIRAFDEWKAMESHRDIVVLSEDELSDSKKMKIIDALEIEINRLKEKYSINSVPLSRDIKTGQRFYILTREKNAQVNMTDKEVESVINHIMRLDKLCIELDKEPMSEEKLRQRLTNIINKQFSSGGLKPFPDEKQGGQEIPNLKKLLKPSKGKGKGVNLELELENSATVSEIKNALFEFKKLEEDYNKIIEKDYGVLKSKLGPLLEKLKDDWLDAAMLQPVEVKIKELAIILKEFNDRVKKIENTNKKSKDSLMHAPIGLENKNKILAILKAEMLAIEKRYGLSTVYDARNDNLLIFDKDGDPLAPDNQKIAIIEKRLKDIHKVIQFFENDKQGEFPSVEYHEILLELKNKMIPTKPTWVHKSTKTDSVIDKAIAILPVKKQESQKVGQKQEQGKEQDQGMSRSVSWLGPGGK